MSVKMEDEPVRMEKMSYGEIVKAIIVDETQYLRDLNMIIRVFRAPFVELFPRSKVSRLSEDVKKPTNQRLSGYPLIIMG